MRRSHRERKALGPRKNETSVVVRVVCHSNTKTLDPTEDTASPAVPSLAVLYMPTVRQNVSRQSGVLECATRLGGRHSIYFWFWSARGPFRCVLRGVGWFVERGDCLLLSLHL